VSLQITVHAQFSPQFNSQHSMGMSQSNFPDHTNSLTSRLFTDLGRIPPKFSGFEKSGNAAHSTSPKHHTASRMLRTFAKETNQHTLHTARREKGKTRQTFHVHYQFHLSCHQLMHHLQRLQTDNVNQATAQLKPHAQ